MAQVKRCSKCQRELSSDDFYNRQNGAADGKQGICKTCWEDAWGSETWTMSVIPSTYGCPKCVFEPECKHNIWVKTFDPYCFVEGKYHDFYLKVYGT